MTQIHPMAHGSLLERCARMQMGDNQAALPPISVGRARRKRHRLLNAILAMFTTALTLLMIGLWWVS
jgi:hypothetical protein